MTRNQLRIELERQPFAGGKEFGETGAYERLLGKAFYAIDPDEPGLPFICDLDLAPRNQEGLVEFFPHRGAIVVGVHEDEVGPIYDVRAVLEARAFARAARSVTPDDLAGLSGLIDAMVEALDRQDFARIVDLDMEFHGHVVELSGFRLLRQLWANIDSLVRGQTNVELDPRVSPAEHDARYRKPALSHRELVDALASGRASVAADAARRHIQDASRRLRSPGRSILDAPLPRDDHPPRRSRTRRIP